MIVLGVDPGATTGLALIDVAESGNTLVVETHQLAVKETMLWLRRELPTVDLVGVEKYIITQRTAKLSRQTDALEIIGVVKANLLYILTDLGIEVPLSMHTPADAKTVWNDERLKKHDLYRQAPGHAKDALRHALLATERAGLRIS
jgi:hypothetical protein